MSGASHNKHSHQLQTLDWLGLGLSGLCALHCLALPLLATSLPFLRAEHGNHSVFHILMAIFIVPLGLWAFFRGHRIHRANWVFLGGSLGLGFVLLGLLSDEAFWSTAVTSLGSAILMFFHYQNWQLSRCQACLKVNPLAVQIQPKSLDGLKFANWNDDPSDPHPRELSHENKSDRVVKSATTPGTLIDAGHGG